MTTPIQERSPSLATLEPPSISKPRAAASDATTPEQQSVARRLLERFALIAFGLYHVPLFLNNYPSLGGGGFNDTGLAPRWGHVFTPVGVWVARHAFHMSQMAPQAYAGDNGDVGEEFGRLVACIVIGIVGALSWTIADRARPRARWVDEALRVLLRYSIALGLASYAFAKLLPQQFPPLTSTALETKVGELTPMSLLWSFMQYSRPYSLFGGIMELVAVLLLCFRRTATLGALVCLAVMTNVALLNLAYGVPVKLYSTMIVISAAVLVLYDTPRLLAVFVRNTAVEPATVSPSFQDRIPTGTRWTIKTVLVGSVFASSLAAMIPNLPQMNAPRPGLDGVWSITSFTRAGELLDQTADPARWRRIVGDGFGVMIRLETDSTLRCRQTPAGAPSTITLACSRNRKGELRWTRNGDDLQLEGRFDGTPIAATGRYVDPATMPLLRSKFRWISDR